MKTPNVRTRPEARVLVRKLFKLESSGKYEEALALLCEDTAEFGLRIQLPDIDLKEEAELELRHGSLVGFHGHNRQIAGTQELARDILTRARDKFLSLDLRDKTAEAENLIAISYWRTGEFAEADVWLDQAASHYLPNSSRASLQTHVFRSLILLSRRQHRENIDYCRLVEDDFRTFGDAILNASICSNLGISLKDTGQKQEALNYFNLARRFHERSHHKIYLATVENNLALLYKDLGNFRLAQESADASIAIYKRLKDKTREGSSFETKAQISFEAKHFDEALKHIDHSIALLRKSENAAYLAESLMTRARILLQTDRFQDAVFSMMEAVDLTRQQAGESAAREMIDEFRDALGSNKGRSHDNSAVDTNELELIIPSSLPSYSDYKGVWINGPHLAAYGITEGSLVLVANERVERGDLVAALEKGSDAVLCGVYDRDFGMICLETEPGQPQLFDESEISIVGKIVGVCRDGKNADGKMVVEAISPAAGNL